MTTKTQLALINRAFSVIDGPQDGFSTVRDKLFDMNRDGEVRHRRFMGRRTCGLSVPMAAKLFTIQHLAGSIREPDIYTVDDVTRIRLECLYAQAYARKHGAEFLAAWAAEGITPEQILALDYAELMS